MSGFRVGQDLQLRHVETIAAAVLLVDPVRIKLHSRGENEESSAYKVEEEKRHGDHGSPWTGFRSVRDVRSTHRADHAWIART